MHGSLFLPTVRFYTDTGAARSIKSQRALQSLPPLRRPKALFYFSNLKQDSVAPAGTITGPVSLLTPRCGSSIRFFLLNVSSFPTCPATARQPAFFTRVLARICSAMTGAKQARRESSQHELILQLIRNCTWSN